MQTTKNHTTDKNNLEADKYINEPYAKPCPAHSKTIDKSNK